MYINSLADGRYRLIESYGSYKCLCLLKQSMQLQRVYYIIIYNRVLYGTKRTTKTYGYTKLPTDEPLLPLIYRGWSQLLSELPQQQST